MSRESLTFTALPDMTLKEVSAFPGPMTRTPHVHRVHCAELVVSTLGVVQHYDRINTNKTYFIDPRIPPVKYIPETSPGYITTADGASLLQHHARPILENGDLRKGVEKIQHELPEGHLLNLTLHPERQNRLTGLEISSDAVLSVEPEIRAVIDELHTAYFNEAHELHREAGEVVVSDLVDRFVDPTSGKTLHLNQENTMENLPTLVNGALEYCLALSNHQRNPQNTSLVGTGGYIFNNNTNIFIGILTDVLRHPNDNQVLMLSGDQMMEYMTHPEANYIRHMQILFKLAQKALPNLPNQLDVYITRTSGAKCWAIERDGKVPEAELFNFLISTLVRGNILRVESDGRAQIVLEGARAQDQRSLNDKKTTMIKAYNQTKNLIRILRGFAQRTEGVTTAEPFYTLTTENRIDQFNFPYSAPNFVTAPEFLNMGLSDLTVLSESLGKQMKLLNAIT